MAKNFIPNNVESVSFCKGDKSPAYISGVRTGASINKMYKSEIDRAREYADKNRQFRYRDQELKDFRDGLSFAKKSGVKEVYIINKEDLPFKDNGK